MINSVALFNKGTFLYRYSNLADAVSCFRKTAEADPLDADIWCTMGMATENLGMRDQTVEYYAKAIKLQPHHSDALLNHGNGLRLLGRHSEALTSFNCALDVNSDDADVWLVKGGLMIDVNF